MAKISLKNINFIYSIGTTNENHVLKDINLEISTGDFVGIIGHTGSGKSTMIQLMNALAKPTEGEVCYDGQNVWEGDFDKRELRCKVGLVFQNPENQLFEENVLKDVCFGPKNQGLSEGDAIEKAKEALDLVGIDSSYYDKSVFELSGGEKRRIAIAGVLAMEPEILILDEPTAGLDPGGRDLIMRQIQNLYNSREIGIVWVSHNMDIVAQFAKRIIVMNDGEIMYDDEPFNVFAKHEKIAEVGLVPPQISVVMNRLKDAGLDVDTNIVNVKDACDEIVAAIDK